MHSCECVSLRVSEAKPQPRESCETAKSHQTGRRLYYFTSLETKKKQVGKRQGELISQVMCASGMGPLREEGKF